MGWFTLGGTVASEIRYLYVGRFDGRAFRAVVATESIEAAGPHQGRVLAWWRDGDRSVVALIDTADGSREIVLETDDIVDSASFGPDDDLYWVARDRREGARFVVWRRDLAGGRRERVGRPFTGTIATMTASNDLRRVVVASIADDGVRTFRLLDTRDGSMTRLPVDAPKDAIGVLGPDVLTYADDITDRGVPVISISADGEVRTLAHTAFLAEVYVDGAGEERLVVDAWADGQYQVLAHGPGGSDPEVVHTAGVVNPTYAAPRLSLRFWGNGNETHGWVPVLPGGMPLHDAATDVEEFRGMDRYLVSLDGTPIVDLGPEREAQVPRGMGAE
jgi:hypothetical protein